ncbi:MAG: hypothetical protein IJY42_05220 [Clostridia bacterium]|nr:hypothetical protein [Clostridia bacterium]
MKKVLCLLISMLMLLSVLASCSGSDAPSAETTTPVGGGETTTVGNPGGDAQTTTNPADDQTTTPYTPDLTVYPRHEGYSFADSLGLPMAFTFLVRNNRFEYIYAEESATGDVERATYKRNQLIESMYDVKIGHVAMSEAGYWSNKFAEWNVKLSASTGEYDIVVPDCWWSLEFSGNLANLMALKEIDLEEDYYTDGWNSQMIINQRMYSIVGDATLDVLMGMEMIFFNKTIAEEYSIDLYQTVENGDWTLDYMLEILDGFEATLLNSDPNDDIYGVQYDQHSVHSGWYSSGLTVIQTNPYNNIITPILDTQRNVQIADKFQEVLNHNATTLEWKTGRTNQLRDAFVAGKTFMFAGLLLHAPQIKQATDLDFGLVITPKFGDADEYVSQTYHADTWSIASKARDRHMVAAILDSIMWLADTEDPAGLGEDRLVHTYMEVVLAGQVAESPEDVKQINLCRELLYYDFAMIVHKLGVFANLEEIVKDSSSLGAQMQSITAEMEQGLTSIMEFYNR